MIGVKKTIKILSIVLAVAGIVVWLKFFSNDGGGSKIDLVTAQRGDVVQQVSATGKVKPAEEVELSFQKSGKVTQVTVDIGDKVVAGQVLARLDSSELLAQLMQANSKLATEQTRLAELEKGTREEELEVSRTKVINARQDLEDAQANLEAVTKKAAAELDEAYSSALGSAQKAATLAKSALLTLTDIQYNHFYGSDQESFEIARAKQNAVASLLGAEDAGSWRTEFISGLEGGAFGLVNEALDSPDQEKIDEILTVSINALRDVKEALDAIPSSTKLTATEKTDLGSEKSTLSTQISSLLASQDAILVQRSVNAKNIALAKEKLNSAEGLLRTVQSELALKEAGSTQEQIDLQKTKIDSAKAGVRLIYSQLAQRTITSPINGIVSKNEARVGEIVSASVPVITIISAAQFEIEANIPEVDAVKLEVGDLAKVTLDAYGDDVLFEARLVKIDPAETVIEGVSTYRTILQFASEDERIKSGMTANLDVVTDRREDVVFVPQRVIEVSGGEKYAKILKNDQVVRVKLEVGLRGSDGFIEIIKGINAGDKVVVPIK